MTSSQSHHLKAINNIIIIKYITQYNTSTSPSTSLQSTLYNLLHALPTKDERFAYN